MRPLSPLHASSRLRRRILGVALSCLILAAIPLGTAEAQTSKRPSNLVSLRAGANGFGPADLFEITTAGLNTGPYTVPAGQVLVITSISVSAVTSSTSSTPVHPRLFVRAGVAVRERFVFGASRSDGGHVALPSGLVVASGHELEFEIGGAGSQFFNVWVTGYHAPDV